MQIRKFAYFFIVLFAVYSVSPLAFNPIDAQSSQLGKLSLDGHCEIIYLNQLLSAFCGGDGVNSSDRDDNSDDFLMISQGVVLRHHSVEPMPNVSVQTAFAPAALTLRQYSSIIRHAADSYGTPALSSPYLPVASGLSPPSA